MQRLDDFLVPPEIRDVHQPQTGLQRSHTVNGIAYCNLPGLNANFGDRYVSPLTSLQHADKTVVINGNHIYICIWTSSLGIHDGFALPLFML